jgi:hypothetical protein
VRQVSWLFPFTNKQWERFQQWHVQTSIVICYRVDSSEIQDNIDKSHIDLTNGEIYDAAELADMPDEAKEGLVPTSDEKKDMLRLRNYFIPWLKKIRGEEYRPSKFSEIDKKMGTKCLTIYADNSVTDIIRQLSTILQNSHYYS